METISIFNEEIAHPAQILMTIYFQRSVEDLQIQFANQQFSVELFIQFGRTIFSFFINHYE